MVGPRGAAQGHETSAPFFKVSDERHNGWVQPRGADRTCELLERRLPHVGCNPLLARPLP